MGLSAAAINDAGQVVGSAWIDDASHAVLWQGGVTTDLGYGAANDINDSGHVVGDSAGGSGFLWTPTTPNGSLGTFTVLESLFATDTCSTALGVNNAGHVVGKSLYIIPGGPEAGSYEEARATLWAGGEPQSLSGVVVPDQSVISARAINDSGQIIAHRFVGAFDRSDHPVLLTPITVPLMTISDATVTEGNAGTRTATFTVTLSRASTQAVTVAYATANGAAAAGSDYQAASFPRGPVPDRARDGYLRRVFLHTASLYQSVSHHERHCHDDEQTCGSTASERPRRDTSAPAERPVMSPPHVRRPGKSDLAALAVIVATWQSRRPIRN